MLCRRAILGGLVAAAALVAGSVASQAQTPGLLQQIVSRGTLRIAVLPSLPPYSKMTPGRRAGRLRHRHRQAPGRSAEGEAGNSW